MELLRDLYWLLPRFGRRSGVGSPSSSLPLFSARTNHLDSRAIQGTMQAPTSRTNISVIQSGSLSITDDKTDTLTAAPPADARLPARFLQELSVGSGKVHSHSVRRCGHALRVRHATLAFLERNGKQLQIAELVRLIGEATRRKPHNGPDIVGDPPPTNLIAELGT